MLSEASHPTDRRAIGVALGQIELNAQLDNDIINPTATLFIECWSRAEERGSPGQPIYVRNYDHLCPLAFGMISAEFLLNHKLEFGGGPCLSHRSKPEVPAFLFRGLFAYYSLPPRSEAR